MEMAIERILDIARMAAPRIRIPRGPKVTAAAHEFLEKHGIRGRQRLQLQRPRGGLY